MTRYVFTAALGAVLLFVVQPMVARGVLPWFGGSAAVWTTCQLTFQVLLLGGYGWTHVLVARLSARAQVMAQLGLVLAAVVNIGLAIALWGTPLLPPSSLRPEGSENPLLQLVLLLLVTVALPFLALSTTGPLVQAWANRAGHKDVYRLYALSNAGSLLGLLGYPLVLEPTLTLRAQGWAWTGGFLAWVFVMSSVALVARRHEVPAKSTAHGAWKGKWLVLSALPVVLLLAVTNYLTQEVAPVPFLWVLPLVVYLLSFIATFERVQLYQRRVALPLLAVLTLGVAGLRSVEQELPLPGRVALFIGFLFVACLAAHGELAASRPPEGELTRFYAALALGGAAGGVFTGLVAPAVFSSYAELEWGLMLTLIALGVVIHRSSRWTSAWWLLIGLTMALLFLGANARHRGVLEASRDFYGVLRVVTSSGGDDEALLLMHGRTIHGAQQLSAREAATTYYAPESGVGRVLNAREGVRRVGVIGLGIGTLAAYAKPGEAWRFYEISPDVVTFAEGRGGHFSFLPDARTRGAQVTVVTADARSALEHEAPNGFDVLVLDAFSSDSVPVHLLTKEALALYARHLKPNGVLAMHLSNRSLNLVPIATRLAKETGFARAGVLKSEGVSPWALKARWLLLARSAEGLDGVTFTDRNPPGANVVWTDDYSSLWSAVEW